MELEVEGIWDMFKSNVTVTAYYTKEQQSQHMHWMLSKSSRTSFYLESSVDHPTSLTLTLPPVLFELKAGESIYILLSTNVADYLDLFMNERNEYYTSAPNAGYFRVLDTGKNNLKVSVETKEAPL